MFLQVIIFLEVMTTGGNVIADDSNGLYNVYVPNSNKPAI